MALPAPKLDPFPDPTPRFPGQVGETPHEAWDGEKSARVEGLGAPQLEVLRQHLLREKSWPLPFPDPPG